MKSLMRSLAVAALMITAAGSSWAKDPVVGEPAPDFTLKDNLGNSHSLSTYRDKYVVLEWINHGCPFVQKHYDSNNMQTLQKEMTEKGVVWLSVASSAKGKEGHASAKEWGNLIKEKNMASTAVLIDEDGKTGKLYGAKTTPHMFVINPQGVLIYKGAIDDKASADPADVAGAKNYVRAALEESMAGKPVSKNSSAPYGCSVKYAK